MQYLKQVALILVFSFLGEVCRALIPLPIPASIYGMVLLFAALSLKIVKSAQVRDAGGFLTSVLPVLFVAPAVNLMVMQTRQVTLVDLGGYQYGLAGRLWHVGL